jgi:hypothetical protein
VQQPEVDPQPEVEVRPEVELLPEVRREDQVLQQQLADDTAAWYQSELVK